MSQAIRWPVAPPGAMHPRAGGSRPLGPKPIICWFPGRRILHYFLMPVFRIVSRDRRRERRSRWLMPGSGRLAPCSSSACPPGVPWPRTSGNLARPRTSHGPGQEIRDLCAVCTGCAVCAMRRVCRGITHRTCRSRRREPRPSAGRGRRSSNSGTARTTVERHGCLAHVVPTAWLLQPCSRNRCAGAANGRIRGSRKCVGSTRVSGAPPECALPPAPPAGGGAS